ncbi:MAG: EF-Tu/IF-2/RF-3 family GTPase [Candidatus Woesearchaeota archaeon]
MTIVTVNEVYEITGIGSVVTSSVKSGTLKPGMITDIEGKRLTVSSIEKDHAMVQEAHEGEECGFTLKGAKYDTLERLKKKDVEFSENPEPISPGFFGSIRKIFKK